MARRRRPSHEAPPQKSEQTVTMDDVLSWNSKVLLTEGQKFTTPKPGLKEFLFTMFHASEFPFGGGVPSSPLPLSSAQAKAMEQAVIVLDEFGIEPMDSKNPNAQQNRRHRTFAKTTFSLVGNVLKRLGFYAEVTSIEFLLKNNKDVLQIGGLKDEATSESVRNSPNPPIFTLVNSWRFGGGKYLGSAEGKSWGPNFLGPFGLLLGAALGGPVGATVGRTVGAAVGGEVGELYTTPNYASCSALVISPSETADGAIVAKTKYQPLATHHFAFELCTTNWKTQFIMKKDSSTNNPAEAINLKSDLDAFRIAHKDGQITPIKLDQVAAILTQKSDHAQVE